MENAEGGGPRNGRVEFGMDTSTGLFALTMAGTGDPGLVRGNQTDGYYLAIEPGENWTITFGLDPKRGWTFDDPAITFKDPKNAEYYTIISASPTTVVMQARSTHAKPIPKPWPGVDHPFNLHLRVKQSDKVSYGLIIDPDLKNPPPNGG